MWVRATSRPKVRGRNFFPYKPVHLEAAPPRPNLANIVNTIQHVLSSGEYQGAIWTQGSPRIEEALYWFNLLLDIDVPLCANSAQRPHGTISNDGPRNIVDSVDWIKSHAWADETDRNCAGVVLVSDQRVFAAREVARWMRGPVAMSLSEDTAVSWAVPAARTPRSCCTFRL